ncbi:MAG: sigma-70 family RNA polymerase sigma factor [Pseudomonadota bacterium]
MDGVDKPLAYHAELLLAVRDAQDKSAFAELFEHFAPRVKSFLMKGGADIGQAEECAQEVMVTVWQKAHLYDPMRATASTWIFTIARNKRIDALRKQNRPEPQDLYWMEDSEPDTAEIVGLQQEADKLAKAVEDLPKKQRDMIKRAFYGELTHQEIAEETGLPLGTIKSRIRWALEKLRHGMA